MYARVTEVRVDTEKATLEEVLTRFRAAVLPALQEQPGYRGIYVLGTPHGTGVLVSLWATEQAATAIHEGGWYFEVLRDFATIFREAPDRTSYRVLVADLAAGSEAPDRGGDHGFGTEGPTATRGRGPSSRRAIGGRSWMTVSDRRSGHW